MASKIAFLDAAPNRSSAAASALRSDLLAILLIWAGSAGVALFIAPQPHGASTTELLYYTVYNVVVGAFVGLYLFDRVPRDGYLLYLLRATCALIAGTLVNEMVVEPLLFGDVPINGQGLYYGLTDALSTAGLFLLIRLAERLRALRQVRKPICESSYFFVRVANGALRVDSRHVLYLKAERDFTRIVCSGSEYFVSENLKSVVAKAAGLGVVRIHRSFAVNLRQVAHMTRTEVRLGDTRLPVGRRYAETLMDSWLAL